MTLQPLHHSCCQVSKGFPVDTFCGSVSRLLGVFHLSQDDILVGVDQSGLSASFEQSSERCDEVNDGSGFHLQLLREMRRWGSERLKRGVRPAVRFLPVPFRQPKGASA